MALEKEVDTKLSYSKCILSGAFPQDRDIIASITKEELANAKQIMIRNSSRLLPSEIAQIAARHYSHYNPTLTSAITGESRAAFLNGVFNDLILVYIHKKYPEKAHYWSYEI